MAACASLRPPDRDLHRVVPGELQPLGRLRADHQGVVPDQLADRLRQLLEPDVGGVAAVPDRRIGAQLERDLAGLDAAERGLDLGRRLLRRAAVERRRGAGRRVAGIRPACRASRQAFSKVYGSPVAAVRHCSGARRRAARPVRRRAVAYRVARAGAEVVAAASGAAATLSALAAGVIPPAGSRRHRRHLAADGAGERAEAERGVAAAASHVLGGRGEAGGQAGRREVQYWRTGRSRWRPPGCRAWRRAARRPSCRRRAARSAAGWMVTVPSKARASPQLSSSWAAGMCQWQRLRGLVLDTGRGGRAAGPSPSPP